MSQTALAATSHSAKADEQAGALIFRQQDCAHCTARGIGGKKDHLSPTSAKTRIGPGEDNAPDSQRGQKMPPFGDSLTDAQIAQLVAYLRAKHKPAPQFRVSPLKHRQRISD